MIRAQMLESLFDPTIILSAFVQSLAQEIDVAIAGDGIVEHIMHAPGMYARPFRPRSIRSDQT